MNERLSPPPARTGHAAVVILAGVCAAVHVGKLPPAIDALRQALGMTLVQAGFLLSLVQLAGMAVGIVFGVVADAIGAKFICERTDVATVSKWLSTHGWTVVTSEIGYLPKTFPDLTETQREEVGEFLEALEENDDVHRVWAAVK